jgi:hypothetical protein
MNLPGRWHFYKRGTKAREEHDLHVIIIDISPNASPLLGLKEAVLARKLVRVRGKAHHMSDIN